MVPDLGPARESERPAAATGGLGDSSPGGVWGSAPSDTVLLRWGAALRWPGWPALALGARLAWPSAGWLACGGLALGVGGVPPPSTACNAAKKNNGYKFKKKWEKKPV